MCVCVCVHCVRVCDPVLIAWEANRKPRSFVFPCNKVFQSHGRISCSYIPGLLTAAFLLATRFCVSILAQIFHSAAATFHTFIDSPGHQTRKLAVIFVCHLGNLTRWTWSTHRVNPSVGVISPQANSREENCALVLFDTQKSDVLREVSLVPCGPCQSSVSS